MAGGKKVNVTQITAAVEQAKAPAKTKKTWPDELGRAKPPDGYKYVGETTKLEEIRARGWIVVMNNYTEDDKVLIRALGESAKYAIAGFEVGAKCGTPHIQGFVYFESLKTLKQLKTFHKGAHFESMYSDCVSNMDYCSKVGTVPFFEYGVRPQQGHRTDLEQCMQILRTTGRLRDIENSSLNFQCVQRAKSWLSGNERGKTWQPEVVWFWGDSGTGKSSAAQEWLGYNPEDAPETRNWWVSKADDAGWIDGYDAHPDVFLEDIAPNWYEWKVLLRMLGPQECSMKVKGGFRQFKPRRVAITTLQHPRDFMAMMESKATSRGQDYELLRRLTRIVQVVSETPAEEAYMPAEEIMYTSMVKDAEGGESRFETRTVHQETPADDACNPKNFKFKNNLGVPVTPGNGIQRTSCRRARDLRDEASQDRQQKANEANYAYWQALGQEAICFPQVPSLCETRCSTDSDDIGLPDDPGGTQGYPGAEDDGFD